MTNQNLYLYFQKQFKLNNNPFLVSNLDTLRFDQIDFETGYFTSMFLEMGIVKGDRVIVQVEKSISAVLLYLACLKFGAIYIPLNPAYTNDEVSYFLGDSNPSLFVCMPDREEALQKLATQVGVPNTLSMGIKENGTIFSKLKSMVPSMHVEECSGDDLAAILYTSGTTGRSKGAMLTHINLLSNAMILLDYWAWRENDVLLHALPIFHVHGLFVALHCAILNGSKVIFLDQFDKNKIIEELPNSTVMMGVPTFYVRLLEDKNFTKNICSKMRLFISGSAPLLPDTFNLFESKIGMRILERYGMTETGMIASNPYIGDRIAGTVGYFLPSVFGRISGLDGQELTDGTVGILETKGANVFAGYWGMPEKTKEEFTKDGFFITGDLASMGKDGRITIVGREKDLIISGGYNVYPKEIESLLDDLEEVSESCVIGLPQSDFGEAVTALLVMKDGMTISDKLIRNYLSEKLAKFKHPKNIILIKEIPRNTMGKVQKNVLRKKYKNIYSNKL